MLKYFYSKFIVLFCALKWERGCCNTSILTLSTQDNMAPSPRQQGTSGMQTGQQVSRSFLGQTTRIQNQLFKLDLNT